MRNFSDAQSALQTAYGATNSAMEENARFMESITAKQNVLTAEFQKFVLGDGGLEALEKKLLDTGIAFMQFINNIGGLSTILSALGTVLATIAASQLPTLITMIGGAATKVASFGMSIVTLTQNFITARTSGMTFSQSLEAIGVSGISAQVAIQGLVAVVGVAITLFTLYNQKQRELAQAAQEASLRFLFISSSV